jgi:hypothetical protein
MLSLMGGDWPAPAIPIVSTDAKLVLIAVWGAACCAPTKEIAGVTRKNKGY